MPEKETQIQELWTRLGKNIPAFFERYARRWQPPPRLTVSRWADKFRYLSSESSAKPGRYNSSLAPYQREPMDAANDPTVQTTDLQWASQLGKTTVLENLVGYFIDADPSPILWVEPTDGMAADYSKERLAPMIRDTPCLAGKVRDARSRDSGNTIQMKMFPGGSIAMVGANSPIGLAGRPRRVVLEDEIDRWPASAGTEGDPGALAERRTETYWNAVIFRMSTPTIKGLSRIESNFEQTDKRYWFCACPKCGEHQTLKWRQVLWGKARVDHLVAHKVMSESEAQSKFAVLPLDGSDAVYACESCHAHLSDSDRVKMVRSGEWRATAPFSGKRGYHLSGIYSPFRAKKGFKNRLHQMVAQHLEAKSGGRQTLKAWTNTFLAETWEEQVERIDTAPLLKRAEPYGPQKLPASVVLAIATVDVQKTWLQVQVTGLGLDEQTWGIESRTIEGDPEQDDIWTGAGGLAEILSGSYTREDGVVIPVTAAAIDMRHKPKRVVAFVQKSGLPRVYPVYGVGGIERTLLVTTRFSKHYRLRTYAVDSKLGKDTVFSRLAVEEPGPRYMHFPAGHGYNEEYFAQLTGEVLRTRYQHGHAKQFYEKVRERNEALDLSVYFLAAVDILRPNLTAIAKRQTPPEGFTPGTAEGRTSTTYQLKPPATTAPAPAQKPQRMRIKVGRWP